MKIFQKGFNYSQDGPGNRLVYHMQGCNMRCIWCSNPEGMEFSGGKEFDVSTIIAECISAKPMFFDGGGVTFTGGEATAQFDELKTVLIGLKTHEIHTAIETNGTHPRLSELFPYIDYLIMDFKHTDSEVLKQFTGIGNEVIKKNFETICLSGKKAHIRIPVINNINSEIYEEFAKYFSTFNTENIVFEFLSYHEYGKEKWKEEYKIKDGFVSKETINKFNETFKKYGLKTITT